MRRHLLLLAAIALCTTLAWSPARADNTDRFDFRFSPIGLIVGSFDVYVDVAIAPEWTIGPALQYWHFSINSGSDFTSSFDITAYALGVRANWFQNGVYTDGLYIGPSVKYANVTLKTSDSNGSVSGSVSGVLVGALIGYGWFWNSFNMMLGAGANLGVGNSNNVTVTGSSGNTTTTSTSLSGLDLEFSLGWTF
jgi:hypothetical protein